jgi:Peptidase family M3
VVRQIAFYSFERKLHLERRNGELTAAQICGLWMSEQAESLGPPIELGTDYESYWAYIPHFVHSPFYVYAYCLRRRRKGFSTTLIRTFWLPFYPVRTLGNVLLISR